MNQHIKKMWHSYISVLMYSHTVEKNNCKQSRVEYYTTIKEIVVHAIIWMNLKQKNSHKKTKNYLISCIRDVQKRQSYRQKAGQWFPMTGGGIRAQVKIV